MFVRLVVVVAAVPLVLGQFGQFGRKPGVCSPSSDIEVCDYTCYLDVHCPLAQKCCRTACGGTFCSNPVTPPIYNVVEKRGSCPNPPTGPWVCSSRCALDSDCRGKKKCCRNRCGAKACITPEEDMDNEIED